MRAADAKGAKAPVGSQPAVTDLIRTSDELYLDFARDDLGHPELPDLPAQLYEELHHHCHQANPPLVCRTYRHPMYLRRDAGRLAARHINPAHEQLNHGKSPEHEACKERILQMAGQRGLIAHEESSRGADGHTHPGRISDVVLHGAKTIGFEAAYTDSALAVTRKFNRGARDGVTVYFGGPRERTASRNFIDRVPYGTYNDIPALEIRRGRPMPIISGLRRLRRWRCASEPTACPHFGKPTLCTRTWHSAYLDPEGQIDQDDVLYNLATGTWVPIHLPAKQGSTWQIVPANSVEIFLDDGGTLLDTTPTTPGKKTKRPPQPPKPTSTAPTRSTQPHPDRRRHHRPTTPRSSHAKTYAAAPTPTARHATASGFTPADPAAPATPPPPSSASQSPTNCSPATAPCRPTKPATAGLSRTPSTDSRTRPDKGDRVPDARHATTDTAQTGNFSAHDAVPKHTPRAPPDLVRTTSSLEQRDDHRHPVGRLFKDRDRSDSSNSSWSNCAHCKENE